MTKLCVMCMGVWMALLQRTNLGGRMDGGHFVSLEEPVTLASYLAMDILHKPDESSLLGNQTGCFAGNGCKLSNR